MSDIKEIIKELTEFRDAREWEQFHNPKDLALALNIEAGELGESMNKVIPNASICLFKKCYGGSRNGEIVLVESSNIQDSDFGSGYTIKEYESLKSIDNTGGWKHSSIRLKPLSDDKSFENIKLVEDESVSLNVLGRFIRVL